MGFSYAWESVSQTGTYLVKLFFYISEGQSPAEYLYGFATPFQLTQFGLNQWSLRQDSENAGYYALDGYLTGENLRQWIGLALEGVTLGQLLESLQITVNVKKTDALSAVSASFLCNGRFVYRPAYLLPAEGVCIGILPECKPLQAFDDSGMYCESLFGLGKRQLYMRDGCVDVEKATAIWRFLGRELPLHHNFNEMSRLNNFEIFSYLGGMNEENSGVHWRIIDHEDSETVKKVADAVEITLDHTRLRGRFALQVRLCNTQNAFSDTMHILCCAEEDSVLKIPLSESVSYVELRLWKLNGETEDNPLIYHSGTPLMRQIHMSMQIQERRLVLHDDWSRRMQKINKNTVNEEAGFYSTEELSCGNRDNEPWPEEEEQTQKDFREILGADIRPLKGVFFDNGLDKTVAFLEWLKNILRGSDIHRVILIDPYIEVESILKFIRCVGDTGIAYEIYTDSYAGGENKKNEDRIKRIRAIRESLRIIIPPHFIVRTSTHTANMLHDRYLILVGKKINPTVFVLTNSLDGMAKKHDSLVTPVDNHLARQVFDYYLELLERLQDEGRLETLCESDGSVGCVKRDAEELKSRLPFEATKENFIDHFWTETSQSLTALAYMHAEDKEACIQYCLNQDQERVTDRLVSVIVDVAAKKKVAGNGDRLRHTLSLAQLLTREFSGKLLTDAEHLIRFGTTIGRYGDDWGGYYAGKLLWRLEPAAYCTLLAELAEKGKGYGTFSPDGNSAVTAQMLSMLVYELAVSEPVTRIRDALLRAKLPLLRALGICSILELPRELRTAAPTEEAEPPAEFISKKVLALSALEKPMEKLDAMINLCVSLQTVECQRRRPDPVIQKLIDQTGEEIAGFLAGMRAGDEAIPEPEVLYEHLHVMHLRNPEDICKILAALQKNHTLSTEGVSALLIRLCLEKYRGGMNNAREFYRVRDLEESSIIIDYLARVDVTAIGSLKAQMNKMERILAKRLCKAFLKTQNYRLWKSSIDLYTCLIYLEERIAAVYAEHYTRNDRAVEEYRKIASNFTDTLEKYSEVYRFSFL